LKNNDGTYGGPDWFLGLLQGYWRATIGPEYPPSEADQRDVGFFGLALPARATFAVLASTALILVDQLRILLPGDLAAEQGPLGLTYLSLERFLLFLVVPALIVVLGFRDRLRRYGLGIGPDLGSITWGCGLLIAGLVVMTPIILVAAGLPQFHAYYGAGGSSLPQLLLNNLVELVPAEFLLRGFLMFALWRRIGPLALIVVQVPFILTHVGKPDVELWSTFIGGTVFAWLNQRTGSILWSAIGHVYVLTLMEVAVGATG
jgi:membrane protease YdiL (CAAX protease family)